MQLTNPCPTDPAEIAEAYIQHKLSPPETAAFEDHYIGCPACVAILQQTVLFVEGITAACREFRSKSAR